MRLASLIFRSVLECTDRKRFLDERSWHLLSEEFDWTWIWVWWKLCSRSLQTLAAALWMILSSKFDFLDILKYKTWHALPIRHLLSNSVYNHIVLLCYMMEYSEHFFPSVFLLTASFFIFQCSFCSQQSVQCIDKVKAEPLGSEPAVRKPQKWAIKLQLTLSEFKASAGFMLKLKGTVHPKLKTTYSSSSL